MAISRGNVTINDRFFEELGRSTPVVALVREAASRVMATAKASAPRDTGAYANSIHLETKQAAYRTVILVVASDHKSMLIESKTGNLARAIKANGGSTRRTRR